MTKDTVFLDSESEIIREGVSVPYDVKSITIQFNNLLHKLYKRQSRKSTDESASSRFYHNKETLLALSYGLLNIKEYFRELKDKNVFLPFSLDTPIPSQSIVSELDMAASIIEGIANGEDTYLNSKPKGKLLDEKIFIRRILGCLYIELSLEMNHKVNQKKLCHNFFRKFHSDAEAEKLSNFLAKNFNNFANTHSNELLIIREYIDMCRVDRVKNRALSRKEMLIALYKEQMKISPPSNTY